MIKTLLLAVLATLALTGCPKQKSTKKGGPDPSANNAVSAGARAKIRSTLAGIKKACQQFNAEKGKWPADMQELVDSKIWRDEKRKDPWGNDFVIEVEGNKVTVLTYGADGEEGGTGADADFSN